MQKNRETFSGWCNINNIIINDKIKIADAANVQRGTYGRRFWPGVPVAQRQRQRRPNIGDAVRVDNARVQAWQKAAQAQTSSIAGPCQGAGATHAPERTTALVVLGLTVDDMVALVAAR